MASFIIILQNTNLLKFTKKHYESQMKLCIFTI